MKKMTSLVLVLAMVAALLMAVPAAAAERQYLYQNNFSAMATDGTDDAPFAYSSAWKANVMGGESNAVYFRNDAYSLNGNYEISFSERNTSEANITVEGGKTMTDDFVLSYSFRDLPKRTEIYGGHDGYAGRMQIIIAPKADTSKSGNDRNYPALASSVLLDIQPGSSISANNGGVMTALDSAFVPARDAWYDVLIYTDAANETYSAYLKASADENYTCIAKDFAYPDGDYSEGYYTNMFCFHTGQSNMTAFDNIELFYPETGYKVPVYDPDARRYLYKNNFSKMATDGTDDDPFTYETAWKYNIMGGDLNGIYFRNDAYSLDGNYEISFSERASSTANITVEGGKTMTDDFVLSYSFRDLPQRTDIYGSHDGYGGRMQLIIAPKADTSKSGNDRNYPALASSVLLDIQPGGSISANNGGTMTALDSAFVPARNVWYDILIYTDAANETYSAYLKTSADEKYTCIAKDFAYPDGDYSEGYYTNMFCYHTGQSNMTAFDNIELYYPEKDYAIPVVPEITVAATGDYEIQKTNLQDGAYTKASGDEFDYYAMRFVFALTLKEGASASDVQNFGAYMIPWDKLAQGTAIQDSTAKISSYNALDYPITQTVSTFSVDMVGIPKAAVGRTLYVAPFVNGSVQLDGAYKEVIQNN